MTISLGSSTALASARDRGSRAWVGQDLPATSAEAVATNKKINFMSAMMVVVDFGDCLLVLSLSVLKGFQLSFRPIATYIVHTILITDVGCFR